MFRTILLVGATAAVAAAFAAPASAVITAFANYRTAGTGANIYWKNNGTDGSNGSGGSIYTIATPTSTTAGSRLVKFSFLQPALSPFVSDVNALFTLSASVVNTPALIIDGQLIQQITSGSFSFIYQGPTINIGAVNYANGSNLLIGNFTGAAIVGGSGGTSGSFSGSPLGGLTITYTSDFLSFAPTVDGDFSLGIRSIQSALARASAPRAIRTFSGVSAGLFLTDPAPLVLAVPEPATWGMFIAGFAVIGVAARRRRTTVAA